MEFGLILSEQVAVIFLLLLSGMILYQTKLINEEGAGQMTNVLLYLVAPLLILDTYQMEYQPEVARNMLFGFLISLVSFAIAIGVSKLALFRGRPETVPTERFAICFTNCGFMAIPLVDAVFGSMGVLYCTTYLTIFNLLLWTFGLRLMEGKKSEQKSRKAGLRQLLSPTMICVALGVILYFGRIQLPETVGRAVSFLASMNTPLAMLVAGVNIARSGLLAALKQPRVYYVMGIKCFLVPFVTMAFFALLPLDETLLLSILISSACPTAANTIMFAGRFGGDEARASQLFAVTTLVSVVSMPFILVLADRVFS